MVVKARGAEGRSPDRDQETTAASPSPAADAATLSRSAGEEGQVTFVETRGLSCVTYIAGRSYAVVADSTPEGNLTRLGDDEIRAGDAQRAIENGWTA